VGKGTGLGLSVVHGIVASMGGSIHADSAPQRGTTMQVLIPAVAAATVDNKENA
jgi:signal transduction histidine kinase